jgi:hypothetical protein
MTGRGGAKTCGDSSDWNIEMNSQTNNGARGSFFASVAKRSLTAGAIGFAAGVLGAIFLSSSNLGPLMAILVTGPVGLFAGTVWGVVRWGLKSEPSVDPRVMRVLMRTWPVALFYTLFSVRLSSTLALAGAVMQFVVLAGVFVLCWRQRVWFPLRVIAGAVIAVIFLMTLFPPITSPSFGPATVAPKPSKLPIAAFILDPGFDASRHVPEFVVNTAALLIEWMMTIAAGVLAWYFVKRKSRNLSP